MKQPFLSCLVLGLILATSPSVGAKEEPFRFPEGKHGSTGELRYLQGIPVLTVSGSPEEIGEALGTLALKPGKRALQYPQDLLQLHKVGFLWGMFAYSGNNMVKGFPADYRTEMDAMVKASKTDRAGVVVGNTFFDLQKAIACSALLVGPERSAVKGPLLGRNLDYPSLNYINHYSLVTVVRPRGKHAYAAIGFPGLIGVVSGMNDAGLALGVLEVYDVKAGEKTFDSKGLPYALCHRRLLEECTTIAEAKTLLEKLPRTTTINLAVADSDGVAVFEITPGSVVQRDPSKGLGVCTNHYLSPKLKPQTPLNINDSYERYETLEKAVKGDKRLSPDEIRRKLNEVNLGELTLQTMVFEPRALKLHLSIGKVPASSQPLTTLDLKPLFKPN